MRFFSFLLLFVVTFSFPVSGEDFLAPELAFVLKDSVDKDGCIDFDKLKKDEDYLDIFFAKTNGMKERDIRILGRGGRIAFWVNYYHAAVLKLIIMNKGMGRLDKFIYGPGERIFPYKGVNLSIKDVMAICIIGYISDPRVHFIVSNASYSAPKMKNGLYLESEIMADMENGVFEFLNNSDNFRVDKENKKLFLSEIFKWHMREFRGDEDELYMISDKFTLSERRMIFFLMKYKPEYEEFLSRGDYEIEYVPYNWKIKFRS